MSNLFHRRFAVADSFLENLISIAQSFVFDFPRCNLDSEKESSDPQNSQQDITGQVQFQDILTVDDLSRQQIGGCKVMAFGIYHFPGERNRYCVLG